MASPTIIREGCPMRIRKQFWVLFLLLCAALVLVGAPNTEVIKQSGFADFAQGTLGNSGANLYVSRNGQIQVINRWDLNNDGHVDVLISNDHDVVEIIDAFLYSSKPDGFHSVLPPLWKERPVAQIALNELASKESLNRLPAFGGGRSVIADVNRDGYPEIVFCNYIHNYPGVRTAFLYWGSASGYDVAHRTELPTNWAVGQRAEVFIQAGRNENALVVPARAVQWRKGEAGIFVAEHGKARWRVVTLGLSGRDVVEVAQGINSGETVVTPHDSTRTLAEGQRIALP